MAKLIVKTLVAAPLDSVFAVYTDLPKASERIPTITALELLTEGPIGKGTRWRETRLMFKKEAVEEMEITSFEAPHRYTVEANSHGMRYETLFEFVKEGDATNVTWTFGGTPLTFGAKIMAPVMGLFFNRIMRKCMQADLDALCAACEEERVPA